MPLILSTIIAAVVGIALGTVITGLVFKSKNSAVTARLEDTQKQLEDARHQATDQLKKAEEEYNKRLSELKADEQRHYESALAAKDSANKEALDTLKSHYEQSMKEQQERFDKSLAEVSTTSKAATEELLKARQKEFAESSTNSIGQIVNPLKENIAKMEKTMQDSSKEAAAINGAMQENLRRMIEQSKAAQTTTEELTKAFKHKSKVQGDWGETVLTELLESQGLTEGVHYTTQATIRDSKGEVVKNEEGGMLRPDIILHLDLKREVIIDSKVSLTAFFDYVNAENETDRQQFLNAHIASVQQHVKELAKKDYSSYIQPPKVAMNYVIMFVPHTGALWTALNAQPDLWRKAMEQHVYIADEQSLYAALQIIRMTWTQIRQAQNHEELYRMASEMVDRVGQFAKHYESVGKALGSVQKAYNDGKAKLEDHGQSIVVSANKLIHLGAKQSTKNPVPEMIDIEEVGAIEMEQEKIPESQA